MNRKLPKKVRNYFAAEGKRGGETRRENLTPERRKEIAQKAAHARWEKRKRQRPSTEGKSKVAGREFKADAGVTRIWLSESAYQAVGASCPHCPSGRLRDGEAVGARPHLNFGPQRHVATCLLCRNQTSVWHPENYTPEEIVKLRR